MKNSIENPYEKGYVELLENSFLSVISENQDCEEWKEKVVKPFCEKCGVDLESPFSKLYLMFVVGFDKGIEFTLKLEK